MGIIEKVSEGRVLSADAFEVRFRTRFRYHEVE